VKVDGKAFRSLWWSDEPSPRLCVIDQRWLPHELRIEDLHTAQEVAAAIAGMHVRGAPLIGATAAYGVYLAALGVLEDAKADTPVEPFEARVRELSAAIKAARPTAVNLAWAVDRACRAMSVHSGVQDKVDAIRRVADTIVAEELERSRRIGEFGAVVIRSISERKPGQPVNILTHCNAGWLCTVDLGTATAPIYTVFDQGLAVHVWVDETRPRNQGARLTAWELGQHGVPHTVVTDNAGGHLMQRGLVDLVLVGTDRTTYTGDVINKIGTYQKAVAAADNGVPFYVAAPSSSIDWATSDAREVPIEERDSAEVSYVQGLLHAASGERETKQVRVRVTPTTSPASNYAFDVTPARLVTGLITERGICEATRDGISSLFPDEAGEHD
jgi:methylthioribose-1-phosphate isomerase